MQESIRQKFPSKLPSMTPVFILLGVIAVGVIMAFRDTGVSPGSELDWLSQLAHNGDAGAQMQLGLAYRDGRYGLESDPHTGLYWLTSAAKNGNAYAADLVGNAYAGGQGTKPDMQQALHWWRIAARGGNTEAKCELASPQLATGDSAQKKQLAALCRKLQQ